MILTKEKVIYHIQALMMFLNISKDANTLTLAEIQNFQTECLELFEEAEDDPLRASEKLNVLIEKMNKSLVAPYPLLITDSLENLVKGEIAAFEHYLNQELKAKHLSIHHEAPLFNESLHLWEKVGVTLTPKEGIFGLAEIVQKMNRLVPEDQQYPLPDQDQY